MRREKKIEINRREVRRLSPENVRTGTPDNFGGDKFCQSPILSWILDNSSPTPLPEKVLWGTSREMCKFSQTKTPG